MMRQLIGLRDLLANSLAPDQEPPVPTDAPEIQSSSSSKDVPKSLLLFRALNVYLQIIRLNYETLYVFATEPILANFNYSDPGATQPFPPIELIGYQKMVETFETKFWKPLKPLFESVM